MKLINLHSIRTKVVFISVAILCLTIVTISYFNRILSTNAYKLIMNSNAHVTAQNLGMQLDRLLDLGLAIENISGFNQFCAAVPNNNKSLAYAFVADSRGKTLFFSDPKLSTRNLQLPESFDSSQGTSYFLQDYRFREQIHHEVILPVKDRWGEIQAFICIGFSQRVVAEKLRPMFFSTTLIAVLSFVFSVFLLIFTLSIWITRPLTGLLKVIQAIRREDLFDTQVQVNSRDEIGQLADTFNKMILELNRNRKILIEKKRIEKELEIARMIQTSLLPDIKEVQYKGFDISSTMIPAKEVGGDYYDIITDKQGRIWFGIGDVTGHGVMSGLIMMMLQTATFTCIHNYPDITPAGLINITNEVLYENIRKRLNIQRFMTLAFLRGEPSGEFQFSGKHLPVIIYRKSLHECEMVDIKGFWAGVLPDISAKTTTTTFRLHTGDVLFLYSDGITEAIDDKRQLYGYENFISSINKNCREFSRSAFDILQGVINDLFNYMESQRDDISLVVVKKK